MKKLFTLLMSLMAFSALFAQYQKPNDNRYYNDQNATYNSRNYNDNNGNYAPQQDARMHNDGNYLPEQGAQIRNDGAYERYGRKDDFDRRRVDGDRMDNFHRDHDFGYHDRDDWRRSHHRGLGLLVPGLIVGGVIGAVIVAH